MPPSAPQLPELLRRLRRDRVEHGLTKAEQARRMGLCRATVVRWANAGRDGAAHTSTLRLVEGYLACAEAPLSYQPVQPGEPLERVLEAVGVIFKARQEDRLARQQVILRALRAMQGDE